MSTKKPSVQASAGPLPLKGDILVSIDLAARVAILSGGYSGIGVETVKALRSAGASVIVPAPHHENTVTALTGFDRVEIEWMDLLDAASIDTFAEKFLASVAGRTTKSCRLPRGLLV